MDGAKFFDVPTDFKVVGGKRLTLTWPPKHIFKMMSAGTGNECRELEAQVVQIKFVGITSDHSNHFGDRTSFWPPETFSGDNE